MSEKRIKLNQIVKSQLPSYVKEDFPLVGEFLSQYYTGQEYQGGPIDLIQNIDSYIKLSECGNLIKSTNTTTKVGVTTSTIFVSNTTGFPDNYGILKINDEIITYENKTDNSFTNCVRGFSGITSFRNQSDPENLVFSSSTAENHENDAVVENLSVLFLDEFLKKAKKQFLYGFEKDLNENLNKPQFIRQSKDFYSTRGTDESFKILFGALYGEKVDIIRPIENVISPSNANYQKTRDIIVEPYVGDPEDLLNKTLFQDDFENVSKAYAPVGAVEKIAVGIITNTFYKISLDGSQVVPDGSTSMIYGEFSPHAKTKIIGEVGIAQTFIDVDSTLGFPNSGTLSFLYKNGTSGVCTYAEKTINQFLGINTTGITTSIADNTSIDQNTFAYSGDVQVKIRNVLNNFIIPPLVNNQVANSKIKIKNLGKVGESVKENNWLFNTAQSYVVEKLEIIDSTNNTFKLTTKDTNILRIGDKITTHETLASGSQWGDNITDTFDPASNKLYVVNDVFNNKECLISGTGINDPRKITKVTRRISKVDSDIHSDLNIFTANIQNIYTKPDGGLVNGVKYFGPSHEHPTKGVQMVGARHVPFPHATITPIEGQNKVYVASSSLPFTGVTKLNPKTQKLTFGGTYNLNDEEIKISDQVDHNFFTGDAVYYTPQKGSVNTIDSEGNVITQEFIISRLFPEGLYYVKRIDSNTVKLAKSQSDIYSGIFTKVTPDGGVDNVTISSNDIEKFYFNGKKIRPQKLIREILTPVKDGKKHETSPGYTGILVDGVEVLNYKSKDFVHYGELKSINIVDGGEKYDIINPPVLSIEDTVGSGATGVCAVRGTLEDIRILDSGFDYIEEPIIKITGGNGLGANAVAKLNAKPHEVIFNGDGVGLGTVKLDTAGINTSSIGFTTYHKFRPGERVIYDPLGGIPLVGLSTDSLYYVSSVSEYTIQLHKTYDDATSGINTISFTNFGSGVQSFKSLNGKSILSSIVILDKGSGYENKSRSCASLGINTSLNTVTIKNHDYKNGEILQYSVDGTVVDGLSTNKNYYVTVIDNDTFKLSEVGTGSTDKRFFYDTKQFNEFRNTGVGTHSFNYEPISVEVIGKVGISSIAGKTFEAVVQPIFRGEITSVDLTKTGVGYGASEILNFVRSPKVNLYSGKDAVITPVVANGRIVDVSVSYGGTDYNSPPDLVVLGIGSDAKLTPELNSSGNIISVNIQSSGIGYGVTSTSVRVDPSGKGIKFNPELQKWRVNEFRKNLSNLNDDDVFISTPTNRLFELQCSYVYAPRNLRRISYANDPDGNILYGKKDLTLINNVESNSDQHSPIIGWAYDGNPIYGPYGYSTRTGGSIVQLKSGYVDETIKKFNRPPVSVFPPEFFVEDFTYKTSSDESVLDENNGRFCITPEYPNGTYAYFTTLDSTAASDGIFKNFKKPKFPYLIGNEFHSVPNKFNFSRLSNQEDFDLNKSNSIRNVLPYSFNKDFSGYDYVRESYKFVNQDTNIDFAEKGKVDSIGITSGGRNYRINDRVVFDPSVDSSFKADGKITLLNGVSISEINVDSTKISNIEFHRQTTNTFVGIASTALNLKNNTKVRVGGLTTTTSFLEGAYNIGVSSSKLVLTQGIGTVTATGIVTFFNISGNLSDVRENDIFKVGVGTEQIKVLNVDRLSSRLRVLRSVNSTTGVSHTASVVLESIPRRFTINTGVNTTSKLKQNREFFFNPQESLGLGTLPTSGVGGVGIGSTIVFSNPGAGLTQIFAPTQSIYLPNHGLETGDEVVYELNKLNGSEQSPLVKFTNLPPTVNTFLGVGVTLFVARKSVDFIGLSTIPVGVGSTGGFVGFATNGSFVPIGTGNATQPQFDLLYFLNSGIGSIHSLRTQFPVVKGELEKNVVTVVGSGTHGLLTNDTVFIDVKSGLTTTVTVKYNKDNRKAVFNPLNFVAAGIVTAGFSTNTTGKVPSSIEIKEHDFVTGQKVIHTSDGPALGLINNKEYYVYVVDSDTIKLVHNKYELSQTTPKFVGITSAGDGTLSLINPPFNFYRNSNVVFDLSDESLSYTQSATKYAAFYFDFYKDNRFSEIFETTGSSITFDVSRTGTIGVTGDAKVTLKIKDDTPTTLYYKLSPVEVSDNLTENKDIVADDDVNLNNQISILDSKFNGRFDIISTGSTTFTYDIDTYPESGSYSSTNSKLRFTTISTSAYGSVEQITITDGGGGYKELPGITTITSDLGVGAVIEPFSVSVGKPTKVSLSNIGFDYPNDITLRPEALFPQVLRITPLTGFRSIGITSFGRGYITNPSLVVIDGVTKKEITDVDLRYNPNEEIVEILENSESLNNAPPTIIPIGNSNGIRAKNFEYNSSTQEVTVTLKNSFSGTLNAIGEYIDPFPFTVGDKVLVEKASVGVGSTGLGYNSDQYDYALFPVTAVHPNYGGIGIVTYSMAEYLEKDTEFPGVFNLVKSAATLIPDKWFPQFDIVLQPNDFRIDDEIQSIDSSGLLIKGTVADWNNSSKYLTVESTREFEVGRIVEQVKFRGERIGSKEYSSPTGAKGIIKEVISYKSKYNLDYFSIVENGWELETGFLNNEQQRVHDNDYYHAFSYAIKSKVQVSEWEDTVSSLNHTSGFKKFSNLQVESKLSDSRDDDLIVRPVDGTTILVELVGKESLQSFHDFDLASENYITGAVKPYSDEINFKTRLLTDYSESVSNRVVTIDDFSNLFNNNARSTPFADVYRNRLDDGRVQFFVAYIQDRLFTGERQIMIVNTLHDTGRGLTMMNQYGSVETTLDLGSFDFVIDGVESVLRFFPHKSRINDYNVILWSYQIDKNQLGVTTTNVATATTSIPAEPFNPSTSEGLNGSLVSIQSTCVSVAGGAAGTVFTLAGIGTTVSGHRSAKLFVSVEASDGSVEYDQVSVIHDGTNVGFQEYGQLTVHSSDAYSSTGNIGTFFPLVVGNDLVVRYTPDAGLTTAIINATAIGIATEGYIGIGSYDMAYAEMSAQSTGISSSSTPVAVGIASYGDAYDAAYCIVQIADKLNGSYELAEVIIIDDFTDDDNVYLTEFGNVKVGTAFAGLGTISGRRTSDNVTEITFVPNAGIGVSITTFLNSLRVEENTELLPADATRDVGGEAVKDLQNASIESGFAQYEGTESAIKTKFALEHNGDPIFKKPYDGSTSTVVDITNNTITLPNHFFVSGEEVSYAHTDRRTGISSAIGIASTSFPSLGITTSLLPSSLFIIKKGEDKVQLARTAEDALKEVAVPLDLTHVGIGTSHSFTGKNPNTRVLVAIDNYLQSPIAGTSVTTTLDRAADKSQDVIFFTGITSFFGADNIRVSSGNTSEVMKILSVGIGTTNGIKVRRQRLGTTIAGFPTGSLVEKIRGNYNIVENEIAFAEAPPGKNPIGSTTNPPSERDFVGITTSSSFQGRVFTRSGITNGNTETYVSNHLYDDLTSDFNGKNRQYALTVDKAQKTGIATNNALILINGVLQAPGSNGNFELDTVGSGTTITWTGAASSVARDINTAGIPVGGVIISVASTSGFGYQPLVSAGGTAVVSLAGTINSVSIGNTGSGYRSGIQTVSVGLQTEGFDHSGITTIGLANVSGGHVTDVTITNPQFFYKPRDIYNVGYSSITGITTITTAFAHNLSVGNEVVVSGIAFTCDYAPAVGVQSANYDNTTGIMTVTTLAAHGLSTTGKSSDVILTGLAFTCGLGATVNHIYPRNRDRFFDTAISVASTTATTITLDVSKSPIGQQYTHRFIGAASSAVIQGGDYSHTFRYALPNAVTTGVGTQFTPTNATYNASTGVFVISIPSHGLSTNDTVGIGTSSIVFSCEMDHYGSDHPYPRPTDPIAGIQTAITAVTTNTITINVGKSELNFYDVSDATYAADTGVLVLTIGAHTLLPGRSIKLKKESLRFTCSKNNFATQHKYPREGDPVFDGTPVVGVASATQFTINAGISTVPTDYVSGGFIQPAIIAPRANNNSPSGQDVAFDGSTVLRVLSATEFEINSGISTRAHLYARGGRVDQLTKIVIDDPLSYNDMQLIHSVTSPGTAGSEARADVVVSQGSTIMDFKITNTGYGYGISEILTLPLTGSAGIPTTPNFVDNQEFRITVNDIASDQFSGWSVGQLQVLDDFSNLFDGSRRTFPITVAGDSLSIQATPGSTVTVQDTLFIFVNDILQIPGESYTFLGGSNITFDEAPKFEDTLKILFYRGTGGADVVDREVIETVKVGDDLTLGYHSKLDQERWLQEKKRGVLEITSVNSVDTTTYDEEGLFEDTRVFRPVVWTLQTEDKFIEGKFIYKDRDLYKGNIFPTTNLIQSVGVGTTIAYVTGVRPFFNAKNENAVSTEFQKNIVIVNNVERLSAAATAIVSAAGTISSVAISTGGRGYDSAPTVTIQNPVGLGTTARAEATASITNGVVTGITVSTAGTQYSDANPPVVLIGADPVLEETNSVKSYAGDHGIITGIGTTSLAGVAVTGLVFDLVIPSDSFLRNSDITQGTTGSGANSGIVTSGLNVGDFFIVSNSNVGHGLTSLNTDGSAVGVGTTYIDNVYRVAHRTLGVTTDAMGFGSTVVTQVVVSVNSLNGLTGLGHSMYFGDYSYGKLLLNDRNTVRSYPVNTSNGITGILTGPIIKRESFLKTQSYST